MHPIRGWLLAMFYPVLVATVQKQNTRLATLPQPHRSTTLDLHYARIGGFLHSKRS